MKRQTTKQFIEKAEEKHGVKYDYSLVCYMRARDKVMISCSDHGKWTQTPNDHLTGYGCPKCGTERTAKSKRSNVVEFTSKSISIHGPMYDYSNVLYKNAITKVALVCNEHGEFWITPDKHLGGGGCQKCSNGISRGERKIQQWLDAHHISYEREKRFRDLCGTTNNSRLRYDFFIPEYNILLEYDGEQHFKPIRVKGRMTQIVANDKHNATVVNDKKKNEYATKHGYTLFRIPYTDYQKIGAILTILVG